MKAFALPLALVLLVSVLAAPPLGAACSCSISANLSAPDLVLNGTSSGACPSRPKIEFSFEGAAIPYASQQCFGSTSCSLTFATTVSCRRTGSYTARATCWCGKVFPLSDGGSYCADDPEVATAEAPLFVDTTPSVGVSPSGPDLNGLLALTVPYSFPNTLLADPQRHLWVYVDGLLLDQAYGSQVSSTWTKTHVTACWRQGSHEIKAVAVACGQGGDAAFRAEAATPVEVDHQPEVSVSLTPLDPTQPEGTQVAAVAFSFPQTGSSNQRLLTLRVAPSGGSLGTLSPTEHEGTWRKNVSCSPGTNGWVEAVAVACGETRAVAAAALPGCPRPPRKSGCEDQQERCEACTGPGGGVGVGGGGPALGGKPGRPALGPGARLRYLAGGAGSPGNPGQAAWNAILGRGWSHDYAERIVPATGGKAWLITRSASFREYTDANNDGLYEKASPEDEYRSLTKTAAGWILRDLDGTVTAFDAAGLWLSATDRNGNGKTATYTAGRLTGVSMPDGRAERFAYHPSGKLASLTEVGVGGVAQRTWSYTWSGNDLTAVEAPDGTGQRFEYGDSRHPGSMTRRLLVGADDGDPATVRPERVEAAWEYDAAGNVARAWSGSPDFATGVDRYELAYDNAVEPARTTVTIHRGDTEREVVVYTLSRTAAGVGAKARVTSISGDCSSCGLGPSSQLFFDDPANPQLPTRIVDGRGAQTLLSYDAHGRVITKTEAAGTPLSRTTTWTYDAAFPALPTRIETPSTAGGASRRATLLSYDAAGNLTRRRSQGVEAGGFFDLETVTTFNAAGQPLSVDPPGYGGNDATSFTYDPARGSLVADSRIDPLVGATTYEHDPFNRQTAAIDPNGVRTETAYDGLNRVLIVSRKGATSADDLITTHEYSALGDLTRTTLPRGNVVEYGYDAAGRLLSIERKPDATTPGERTLYTLDQTGQRVKEKLQRWGGAAWITESFTDYVYLNRCQIGKVVHGGGAVTEYSYDCDGNLEKVWDANHPKATNPAPTQLYAYDALDRLSSVTQPWTGAGGPAAVTSYSYDVQDHLAAVTDAEGNTTTYTYSDRDLITQEVSPVSGVTASAYNEHGEPVTEIDARGVVVTRTVDVLDRVTDLSYHDSDLDTAYTYDTGTFAKGRLTGITRGGQTVAYGYDRFGRLTQDGALTYTWDKNGNRVTIGYPENVNASYAYDFADREQSLTVQVGPKPPLQLVAGATYKPLGPLSGLALGNGTTELRSFDSRYFPEGIEVPGRLSWKYSVDAVGNVLSITDTLNTANSRIYRYQDSQYFLTSGNGPWGARNWTYDRIGNRLTETRGATTDTYLYLSNATGGNTPKIDRLLPGGEPAGRYTFDAAGNLLEDGRLSFSYGDDKRLTSSGNAKGTATYTYDGRGFLSQSTMPLPTGLYDDYTVPTYSSEGLLLHRFAHRNLLSGTRLSSVQKSHLFVFYFAGRPVATLDKVTEGPPNLETTTSSWQYLTVDHLGTPILVTNPAGTQLWQGGFEPFGADYSSSPTILRFPGQWDGPSFHSQGVPEGLYYNVHRWYAPKAGRYTQADPLGLFRSLTHYVYATSSPLNFIDPDGRFPKPPDAKGCGASLWNADITLPKPCRGCDSEKVKAASIHVQSNKQGFCGGGKKCASEEELRTRARGGIDENTGQAWYRPQGDLCVDYCICVHEQDHIRRLFFNPYRDASCEELECLASNAQLGCLKRSVAGRP